MMHFVQYQNTCWLKTYIGDQKKPGTRMMTKPHEQGKFICLFARAFWCNNREAEDKKYRVLTLFPPLLQTHGLSQLFKTVFTHCVNLAVLQ